MNRYLQESSLLEMEILIKSQEKLVIFRDRCRSTLKTSMKSKTMKMKFNRKEGKQKVFSFPMRAT
jgi:hypothetical protein